jgi:DNA segregation ATPase FtsK/SpoIIIE, S-DNA-T family
MTALDETNPITEVNGHTTTLPGPRPPVQDAPPADWPDTTGARPVQGAPQRTRTSPTVAARTALRAVRTVATHRHTRTAVRQGAYVAAGGRHVIRRTWESRTPAMHDRMARAASAVGDHANALEWEARAAAFRRDRHARRIELVGAVPQAAKAAVVGTGVTFGGLLALGIVLAGANRNIHDVLGPIKAAIDAVRWCVAVFEVTWLPALLVSPIAALASLYLTGRRRAELPAWVQSPQQRAKTLDEVITPSILVTALRDLGIGELRKQIRAMDDAGAAMLGPITSAGCGIEVDVYLPSGVSTAEIQAKRQKLAENIGRHKHELFITIPPRARAVRLWIADSGALDEPIGPSPLVPDQSMTADYKAGRAPWGQDLRGGSALVSLFQRHLLVTGLSNQGKTASLRALMLWLALDRRVRFWIADLKGVGDWGMFNGLAEVLIQGPTDEHLMAATHMVEAGVTEMQKRGDLMRELTEKGWSQDKILADPRFAPLVIVIDEAQVAYGSTAVGDDKRPYGGQRNASRYFQGIKAIHDQGRAVSVTTAEGTQDPTDQNLPKRTREGNHIRASLVVGTESQSKMALGEAPVAAGAAPHELRQGLDKGTLVVVGDGVELPPGQSSITIRTHYVGPDDARAIADRAKARRSGGIPTKDAATEPESRDVLADVAEVLGADERVRTEEVVHRLKSHAPGFYATWTTSELTAALRDTLAAPYKTDGGRMHVGLSRVREALEERENEPTDTETDALEA